MLQHDLFARKSYTYTGCSHPQCPVHIWTHTKTTPRTHILKSKIQNRQYSEPLPGLKNHNNEILFDFHIFYRILKFSFFFFFEIVYNFV